MEFKEAFKKLYQEAKGKYNIQNTPKVILRKDEDNAKMLFGKTAYYNPGNQEIVIFIVDSHPKDILRSFCH